MNAMPAERLEELTAEATAPTKTLTADALAQSLIPQLERAFNYEFENLEVLSRRGTTRFVFVGDWTDPGTGKTTKKVIKVDKPKRFIPSQRSLRHVERGYDTRREAETQYDLPEAGDHNIIQVERTVNLGDFGGEGIAKVERYWESQSLEECIENEGPLTAEQTQRVFTQVFDAATYLKSEGFYHRDLKASNILVNAVHTAKVVDLANAGKIGDLEEKVNPTAGGHFNADPLTCSGYTPGTPAYNEQSEVYALGVDMLFALTGQYWWEIHEEEERAIAIHKGQTLDEARGANESLLDKHDMLDYGKYRRQLKEALNSLTGEKAKYKSMLERMLTLNKDSRYGAIEEVQSELETILRPNWKQRAVQKAKNFARKTLVTTGITAATLAGAGALWKAWSPQHFRTTTYEAQEKAGEYAHDLKEAVDLFFNGPKIVPDWNGASYDDELFGINNNFMKMYLNGDVRGPDGVWRRTGTHKMLIAAPGATIDVDISLRDMPFDYVKKQNWVESFDGKVYLEGFEPIRWNAYSLPHNVTSTWDDYGYWGARAEITIPQDATEGVYWVVAEWNSPGKTDHNGNRIDIRMGEKGKILDTERFPVYVGRERPEYAFGMYSIIMNDPRVGFKDPESSIASGGQEEYAFGVIVPEMQIADFPRDDLEHEPNASKTYAGSPRFSVYNRHDLDQATVIGVVLRNGKLFSASFVPIDRTGDTGPEGHMTSFWELGYRGDEWTDTIVELRKQLEEGDLLEKARGWNEW